jgi:hypothetical protein
VTYLYQFIGQCRSSHTLSLNTKIMSLYTFALYDVHQWIGSIVEILPVGRETLNKKEPQSARWELYQSKLFHIYPLICIIFFTCNFYNIASRFPKDILLMLSMRFHNIPVFIVDKKEFPDASNKIMQSLHQYCVHEHFTVTTLLIIHNMCMVLTLVLPSITGDLS